MKFATGHNSISKMGLSKINQPGNSAPVLKEMPQLVACAKIKKGSI
jgi:hypothetical protein